MYCNSQYPDSLLECPNCGGKKYSTICDTCGTIYEGPECPKCAAKLATETADLSMFSKVMLVIITVIFPFASTWYLLFSKRPRKWMKVFAGAYSVFYITAQLHQKPLVGAEGAIQLPTEGSEWLMWLTALPLALWLGRELVVVIKAVYKAMRTPAKAE